MNVKKILEKFNLKSEQEDFKIIHDTIEKGIYFKSTNLWILIFAILIACVGLNMNSTAVVIGAMLISPLMGPIIGAGYSLATYDFGLLRRSLVNFGFAVFSGLIASTLYFLITPISEAHSELLARTQPNIYDVLIAFFGGLAGIIAVSSKQKGNVIPGVAIATALMPPLCTAGYGLATGTWNYFFGAFYLFTINSVFIATATLITVRLLKYPKWQFAGEDVKKTTNNLVSIIVTITMLPAIYFGYVLVNQENFNRNANTFIRNESYIEGDYLLKSEIDPSAKTVKLIYGGKMISENIKEDVLSKAKHYSIADAKITIQQGFSMEDDKENLLAMTTQETEINRLREELAKTLHKQDSIKRGEVVGMQLLNELQPIFPEITSCGTANQFVFSDSSKRTDYFSLFIGTSDIQKSMIEKPKLEKWLRSRLAIDSIKIYIEEL